jgi:hypothetical protein
MKHLQRLKLWWQNLPIDCDGDVTQPWADSSWSRWAGLLCCGVGGRSLHIFVRPSHWVWGWRFTMEGVALFEVGLGPLFLYSHYHGKT